METFSKLLANVREIHRSLVNSPHKGQWRGALMFSLICTWRNGCAINRDASDLKHHRAHYNVTIMFIRVYNQDVRLSSCCLGLCQCMHKALSSLFPTSVGEIRKDTLPTLQICDKNQSVHHKSNKNWHTGLKLNIKALKAIQQAHRNTICQPNMVKFDINRIRIYIALSVFLGNECLRVMGAFISATVRMRNESTSLFSRGLGAPLWKCNIGYI